MFNLFNSSKPVIVILILVTFMFSCAKEADIVSTNISRAADEFEITRRIIFYNGITGEYVLTIEGLCSLGNYDTSTQLTVTCKTGPVDYKKHFLGLSNNVTFFAEQIESSKTNPHHYKVFFKPKTIIPDIDVKL